MGHVLEGGEVGGRVIGSDAAFIVAEDHIHHPMQAVLEKSSLHFGRGPGSGGRSEGLPLGHGKAHALGQDDAKTVKQSRLGGVGLGDAA